ncbi:recombinase family protein, partial [Streptomyces sp. NPDC051098]|uniref:recombinase family protein n=1 Tax=Streptomyces sp. NPDC051098 TaxID=3155411 RepID=UPI00342D9954
MNMVAELRTRGIGFTSPHERLDTLTPGGRLIFHVFAALAEFSRAAAYRDALSRERPCTVSSCASFSART